LALHEVSIFTGKGICAIVATDEARNMADSNFFFILFFLMPQTNPSVIMILFLLN
jgi:hypothetical protein